MRLKRGLFSIDNCRRYNGYYNPDVRWNGFYCPLFELKEALSICDDNPSLIVYKDGVFYEVDDDGHVVDEWDTGTVNTEDGYKELYAVGAYGWLWNLVSDIECANPINPLNI